MDRGGGIVAVAAVGAVAASFLIGGGGQEIQTPKGILLIEEVQLVDSWPAGCTPSPTDPSCLAAQPGFRILVISLVPKDAPGPAPDTGATYGMDSAGRRSEVAATSFAVGGKEWQLIFTPAASATGFILHHPGNEPIELEI